MKCICVLILIFSVFVQSFDKLISIAEFRLNQNFISRTLCINKDIALSDCKGKCQLKKKLLESNQKVPIKNSIKSEIRSQCFTDKVVKWAIQLLPPVASVYPEIPPVIKHSSPVFLIFHPPSFLKGNSY